MRDLTDGRDSLNPNGIKRGGFTGARSLLVEGVPIRVPSQKNMLKADRSPFEFDGNLVKDLLLGESWAAMVPEKDLGGAGLKKTSATPTGAVEAMTFAGCKNIDNGKACQFCLVCKAGGKAAVPPNSVVDEIKAIRAAGVPVTMDVLNTGQMENRGEMDALANCAYEIKRYDPGIKVAAEVWPGSLPKDPSSLKGVIDLFQVNMELSSDYARKILCPAKPKSEAYFSAFWSLRKNGFQVTSALQTNYYLEIEPLAGVLSAVWRMQAMGVVPELLVSRGVIGSSVKDGYWDRKTTFAQNLGRFAQWLDRMEIIAGSAGKYISEATQALSGGCAKCGMCNINAEAGGGKYA